MTSGSSGGSSGLARYPIHPSLIRPVLFAGVEQLVAILEGTLVVALVVGIGLHVVTVGLAAVVLAVVHPVMVRLTARDPQVTRVYLRSTSHADYYAPGAPVWSTHGGVHPSVPAIR